MFQESPPAFIVEALKEGDKGARPILFSTSTDLRAEGRPERQWLLLRGRRLVLMSEGETPEVLHTLDVDEAETFRTHAGVGSGFLQARVGGVWVDVVRYSNSLAGRFVKLAAKLEAMRDGGEFVSLPEDEIDDRHCLGCGLALSFAGDVCPRCINRGAVFSRVWELLRPYRRGVWAVCTLILLGVALELAPPKLQQYLVDHVLETEARGGRAGDLLAALLAIVGALAATRVLLALVNGVKGALANRIGTAMTSALRARMVEKLQTLSVDYYDRYPVGVLMSRVAHDTEALYGLIHQLTGGLLLQTLQLAGVGVMLFTLNAKLALWTLVPMPLVLYGSWFFWKHVYPRYHRYWDSASKQAGTLAGMLSGIRVVKAFAQERREFDRFQTSSDLLRQSRLEVEGAASTFSAAMQLVFSLGGLIVWFVGGRDVLGGEMSLGGLMAFLAYLAMFYTPLSTLAQLTTWLTSFLTASQRVFELLDTTPRVAESETPMPLSSPLGGEGRVRGCSIRFENVTFGYDRNHPVLKNFNLRIRPGEMVGIVGRSGSGKTTLVNLICRFYDTDAGRITLDGRDVRELPREYLRSHVGVVLQEPFLFRGTVWENLVYGRPGAKPEEAFASSKGANAHDFVMRLPWAYDSQLGERGAGLSGGERQRLSIARCLLYDPSVLILDEATSSVDPESERAIQEALAVLTRGRTTIAIAHRLSTLRNANCILVLNRGKLIEEGSHAELMEKDGTYARLVRMQTEVSSEPTVDGLVVAGRRAARVEMGLPARSASKDITMRRAAERPEVRSHAERGNEEFAPRWLRPDETRLQLGERDTLQAAVGAALYDGLFAVRALPATYPDRFISLRYADDDGQEHEVGLVRDLAEWPAEDRALLEQALARRYYVRVINAIHSIEFKYNLLTFEVETDRGPVCFTIRNSHSQAQDYGDNGKLLVDVDDNRYLIPDLDALPRRQHLLFRRFVYW
ncbi:MAG: ABC transporter transmembrane domain-containing protein [Gemmataceae bacterium]